MRATDMNRMRAVREAGTLLTAENFSDWETAGIHGLQIAADAEICDWAGLPRVTGQASTAKTLCKHYAAYGTRLFEMLDGAFAMAIWDEAAARLILAVDRMGIKRIYWRCTGQTLSFASSLAPLREGRAPNVRTAALMEYLVYGEIPAPLTIDADIGLYTARRRTPERSH